MGIQYLALFQDVGVHLTWKDLQPLKPSSGLVLLPDALMSECPPLDILCVPGGAGVGAIVERARARLLAAGDLA